jgi:hypothetical protein
LYSDNFVTFQVLTAVIMKIRDFWDVAPYRAIALKMEAVRTSETSVNSKETTRRYIPEGSNLHSDIFLENKVICV